MSLNRRITIACAAILAVLFATTALEHNAGTTAPRAGYRVAIDPETGALIDRLSVDDAAALTPGVDDAFATSTQDLYEEPSPVAGGGIMVDLRGRFRSSTVAVVDDYGNLTAPCVRSLAPEGGPRE